LISLIKETTNAKQRKKVGARQISSYQYQNTCSIQIILPSWFRQLLSISFNSHTQTKSNQKQLKENPKSMSQKERKKP
jgi:hypothetical protein